MTNEMFLYVKIDDGLIIEDYTKDLSTLIKVTSEITIPAEYDGQPVVEIGNGAFVCEPSLRKVTIEEGIRQIDKDAFALCTNLRSVSLPASLEKLGNRAFASCEELCEVEFKSNPIFGEDVFDDDFKLPAELILANQICSLDITRPIKREWLQRVLRLACASADCPPWFTHAGAFALAAQNDCFRDVDAELLDELIEYCVKEKMVEQTAYLLELKKRKFGFKKGGEFDL